MRSDGLAYYEDENLYDNMNFPTLNMANYFKQTKMKDILRFPPVNYSVLIYGKLTYLREALLNHAFISLYLVQSFT